MEWFQPPVQAKEDPEMQVKQLQALSDLVLKYPATWFEFRVLK